MIVTNIGGFSAHGFLPASKRADFLGRLETSLAALDSDGVEIIAQTMPPYPWHFGGQSFHNVFVDPDEIRDFGKKNNFRFCLDVSH